MSDAEMADDERIEQRSIALALGLLVAVSDAAAARVRLDERVKLTAEHDAKLEAATAALEAVAKKEALFRQADEKLSRASRNLSRGARGRKRPFVCARVGYLKMRDLPKNASVPWLRPRIRICLGVLRPMSSGCRASRGGGTVTDDTFTAVAGLIALITDQKASAKRLAELQAQMAAVSAAQTHLDGARDVFERGSAARTREFDEREAKLRDREVAARLQEANLREREAVIRASKPDPYPPNPNFFGTIRQEPYRE